MRRLRIHHETRYEFPGPVTLLPHYLMLRPREGQEIRIESFLLEISPQVRLKSRRDINDNAIIVASFDTPAQTLVITSDVVLQNYSENPLDFVVEDHAVYYPFVYRDEEVGDMTPYFQLGSAGEEVEVKSWLQRFWIPGQSIETYVLLQSICHGIYQSFRYSMREEEGIQSPAQTLSSGQGSCRDFATLFMVAARLLGMAARFVSGYLFAPLSEQGMGTTHAWAEVYLPGAGWKGFDPTIGRLTGPDHIPVAVSARPGAVPPVAGEFIGPSGVTPSLYVNVSISEPVLI
jgi:transglutaminase-like putative cysteine protease